MDITLWVFQGVLAALFLLSGSAKLSMSKQRMIETGQTGVAPFPLPVIRVVAACELIGVVGLIAPKATGVLPVLTAVAAIGLAIVMIGAIISHTRLREPGPVVVNTAILASCCFIAVATL
jgi:uncharacterized membrane protein YphA (DoxX/SURF4 family)